MKTMRTFTGRDVDPLDLKRDDIDIRDIAHSLAMICRFNGHTQFHYSVAQHSVYVAARLAELYGDRKLALAGLLHDASEAYLGDVVRPLKEGSMWNQYRRFEARTQETVQLLYGCHYEATTHWPKIKDVDDMCLYHEAHQLMNPPLNIQLSIDDQGAKEWPLAIAPLRPDEAEHLFLAAFELARG
jgi:hypothetical protein